jgi:hypothetical protein
MDPGGIAALNAYVHKMLGNYYILLLAGKKC